jgi:hypothetical protein
MFWVLLSGAVLAAAGLNDITFSVGPLFESRYNLNGHQPYVITVTNDGDDTDGMVTIESAYTGGSEVRVPISLPRGADKQVLTSAEMSWSSTATLRTRFGQLKQEVKAQGSSQNINILLIGGQTGDISFVKGGEAADFYAKPELLPLRANDYSSLHLVILGERSESMSDESVNALQRYALTGGHILVLGGAGKGIFRDQRWLPFLGSDSFDTVSRNSLSSADSGFTAFDNPVTTVKPKSPAKHVIWGSSTLPILSRNPVGLGSISVLAFDFTEGAGARYLARMSILNACRTSLFETMAKPNYYRDSEQLGDLIHKLTNRRPTESLQGSTAFSVKAPSTRTVSITLASYLLLVLPINFLVLRLLKRPSLAWFTIPIISLVFSAVFFSFASSLYDMKESRATTSFIFADRRTPAGQALVYQQLFFPRGGQKDLKLEGIEFITEFEDDRYDYYRHRSRNSRQSMQGVDVGEIKVGDLSANNLSFHEAKFRQQLELTGKIESELTFKDRKLVGWIKNSTPYDLESPWILLGDQRVAISAQEIKPKQTVKVYVGVAMQTTEAEQSMILVTDMKSNQNLKLGSSLGSPVFEETKLFYRLVSESDL